MAMAGIYWERQDYKACESVFRNSAEFCSEHEVWRLNVAHTFFMQDNHFKEAIRWVTMNALIHPALCKGHDMI